MVFEAIFKPKSLNFYNASAKLIIKDINQIIKLELQGKGIETSADAMESVFFECPVRQEICKEINIKNDSENSWMITPNLSFD